MNIINLFQAIERWGRDQSETNPVVSSALSTHFSPSRLLNIM